MSLFKSISTISKVNNTTSTSVSKQSSSPNQYSENIKTSSGLISNLLFDLSTAVANIGL